MCKVTDVENRKRSMYEHLQQRNWEDIADSRAIVAEDSFSQNLERKQLRQNKTEKIK